MTAYTTSHVSVERTETHRDCGCGCGCTPCEPVCGIECLERPRYFCGQLLTDADLTALVSWTAARLRLVRQRDGWGVVCGLDVRCDPRKPSRVVIGEGYAISCCGGDIVVCEPCVVDLSDACRPPTSLCDDPCAPAPESEGDGGDDSDSDRGCPEGAWVDILIDAADEDAGGRPALATDGCRRIGSCEPSRVRETHKVTVRRSKGDPLKRAERLWVERYRACFGAVRDAMLPEPDDESPPTYRELRLAAERFALDQACEGGCRALRWICSADAPPDETQLDSDSEYLVDRIRLALLLDCLIAVGRCDCASCGPCAAVPLARVRIGPGARGDCPCRVIAVDDAPPYRRFLGHDCPPAALGRVNLGDLIGQRPEGVCLEVIRRGLQLAELVVASRDARGAFGLLDRGDPPIFDCNQAVTLLTFDDDECLGPRVVGFQPGSLKRFPVGRPHPLLLIKDMTEARIERLADEGITSLDDVAHAPDSVLSRAFPGRKKDFLDAIRAQARELAGGEGPADEGEA